MDKQVRLQRKTLQAKHQDLYLTRYTYGVAVWAVWCLRAFVLLCSKVDSIVTHAISCLSP